MAGMVGGGNVHGFNAHWTWTCFFCCLAASSGGALFGYDNGVMGGVTSMSGFLKRFLPSVYRDQQLVTTGLYCSYDSQILSLLTSSLFLAGCVVEFTGTTAYLNRYYGRKRVMQLSGLAFMLAAVLLAAAFHISMIFLGRVFQGIAISFASVSVPTYNSEMAPPHLRGRLNQLYQIILTLFIFIAQLINLVIQVTNANEWGWRFSLGFAFVPSFTLFLGGCFLPDSPNSLLERGYPEKARRSLEIVRGTKDVDKEYNHLVEAAELAASIRHPWKNMFSYKYRPQLLLSGCSTLFQQWTGINILIFYAPQIFYAFGASKTLSLITALILGACNHLSTYVSFFTADYVGRRPLFLQAGIQMFIALLVIALSLLLIKNGDKSGQDPNNKPKVWEAWYILGFTCLFDMAYAWSWGPLGWLYPTEINPLETRSAGLAVASSQNLLFSFVISQSFLRMLCSLQWGTFLFFAICVLVMTIIVFFFFIETKGLPIEEAPFQFRTHWYWKRHANSGIGLQEKLVVERKLLEARERGEKPNLHPGLQAVIEEVKREIQMYGHVLKGDEDEAVAKGATGTGASENNDPKLNVAAA